MNLHQLKNSVGSRHRRRRVGRGMGSGVGKTCGAGHKGQLARKGHKRKIGFEGGQMRLIRRLPKIGFTNPTRIDYAVVNLGTLDRLPAGTLVTAALLREKALLRGRIGLPVKVLAVGELSHALTVEAHAFSSTAKAKIEAAGGSCKVVKS
ncbi:MAG: 50S ribosomal protein L15 [Lentisphaerae bacterium RIFOXYC12_FULL_60_16]|nr:MAG: 50S ribosomal protein L15 [Lentisphaerae bacterium RIFOXYC12_FULL_60_16]